MKSIQEAPKSDDTDADPVGTFWSPVAPTTSSFLSVESSPHDPPPLEAKYYYYFGRSFNDRSGGGGHIPCPKLVFRTSKDKWFPPSGPHTYPREMKLCDIPSDHELAKNPSLWDPLRDQVRDRLSV